MAIFKMTYKSKVIRFDNTPGISHPYSTGDERGGGKTVARFKTEAEARDFIDGKRGTSTVYETPIEVIEKRWGSDTFERKLIMGVAAGDYGRKQVLVKRTDSLAPKGSSYVTSSDSFYLPAAEPTINKIIKLEEEKDELESRIRKLEDELKGFAFVPPDPSVYNASLKK